MKGLNIRDFHYELVGNLILGPKLNESYLFLNRRKTDSCVVTEGRLSRNLLVLKFLEQLNSLCAMT